MQRSEVPGVMKIVRTTFIGPFNSSSNTNEPHASRCHVPVDVAIPPGTTVIVEQCNLSTSPSGQQISIDSIKLHRLDAYPLPEAYLRLYAQVKLCEIRCYMLDIGKVFHFLAELPALKKLVIEHEAICGEESENSGQVDTSMNYAGTRVCLSLEQVCLKVNEAHFGTRSVSTKRIIEKRVQKIVALIVKTAPNIRIAEFDLPSEMDLSCWYSKFPVGVTFSGSSRPRLRPRPRPHAQPSEQEQSLTTSPRRGPIKLKYRRHNGLNGGPRSRIASSFPQSGLEPRQEVPIVNLEDDGCGDGDREISIVEEIHGLDTNRESDASSTSTRTGGRGRSSRKRRRSLDLLLCDDIQ